MHFTSSVAVLALAASSVSGASLAPYKPSVARRMAFMPLPGQHLARRDTNGYCPDEVKCDKGGDTCAEACNADMVECAASDDAIHCFNPAAGQTCCPNSNGEACEAGYYCTQDKKEQTFCCPQGMDTEACAAAFTVTGGLEVPSQTSTSTSESTSETPSPTSISVKEPETTSYVSIVEVSSTPTPTEVETTVAESSTSTYCPPTVTPGHNGTTSYTPSVPEDSITLLPPASTIIGDDNEDVPTVTDEPTTVPSTDAASTMAAGSSLLLVAAAFLAIF